MSMKYFMGLMLLCGGVIHAHLVDGSLLPQGGETISVGDVVSINWKTETNHLPRSGVGGIDIAFSKDAGSTWTNIKAGFNDNEKINTFKWTVPANLTTSTGMLRICQSGPCTDQKVSKPGENGAPWILVSGLVTIQQSTALAATPNGAHNIAMDFNPSTRNVDVSFSLARQEAVLLQAFDTQGRLAATLIDGNYAAGSHALSVFSNGLAGNGGSLVFKLKVGDQVKTHTWMSVR
jgi:hypothetical protein